MRGKKEEVPTCWPKTCVFMNLMECIGVGEGFHLVSGRGGKERERESEEKNSKLRGGEWHRGEYLKEIMRRRSGLEKRGETEKCAARGGGSDQNTERGRGKGGGRSIN